MKTGGRKKGTGADAEELTRFAVWRCYFTSSDPKSDCSTGIAEAIARANDISQAQRFGQRLRKADSKLDGNGTGERLVQINGHCLAVPSATFRTMLPVRPSVTITSPMP